MLSPKAVSYKVMHVTLAQFASVSEVFNGASVALLEAAPSRINPLLPVSTVFRGAKFPILEAELRMAVLLTDVRFLLSSVEQSSPFSKLLRIAVLLTCLVSTVFSGAPFSILEAAPYSCSRN